MSHRFIKAIGGMALVTALALGSAAEPALAKSHHKHHKQHRHHAKRHSSDASGNAGTSSGSSQSANGETPLTGATLTSAEAAAIAANPGATADDATTETDSSLSGAAYEVHITKSDGTHAVVIEDSSFTVLATQSASSGANGGGCPGMGHGSGGPGGVGNGETSLTGDTLSSAEAAAIAANPGATADGATTETDSSLSGAAYEVHITKSDGSHAVVIEDSSFTVLATQAAPAGPPPGPHGSGAPGGQDNS